jgi:hypothetical protein
MVVQETTNLLLVGDFEDGIDRILINNLDLSADNISITEGIIDRLISTVGWAKFAHPTIHSLPSP